jgi:uncharacterized protein YjgD (DUF1641 family)
MAKAILNIERAAPAPQEQQANAIGEILAAITANKAALLQFLDILNELHKAGLLDIVQGLVKNLQQVGAIGIAQLNKTGAQHMIKNGMSAVQFMGGVEPKKLENLLNSVQRGLDRANRQTSEADKPLGIMDLFRLMRDDEVNASLRFMTNFMQGMGSGLKRHTEGT